MSYTPHRNRNAARYEELVNREIMGFLQTIGRVQSDSLSKNAKVQLISFMQDLDLCQDANTKEYPPERTELAKKIILEIFYPEESYETSAKLAGLKEADFRVFNRAVSALVHHTFAAAHLVRYYQMALDSEAEVANHDPQNANSQQAGWVADLDQVSNKGPAR